MNLDTLFGDSNTLELLLFLPEDQYIPSSKIRRKFFRVKPGTLYARLRKLKKEEFIDVHVKENLERAGDDKHEYKLTEKGIKKREELVGIILRLLGSRIHKEKDIDTAFHKKSEEQDKRQVFNDFLMEFTEECAGIVAKDTLEELQKILDAMLKSYF